jgi:hypothetical protein
MKLALHQLRHDIQAQRWMLVAWFVALALDLATNMGWVVSMVDLSQRRPTPSIIVALTGAVLLLFCGLLPILAIAPDSPVRPERFLSTRPMSVRDLFFAKGLFIALLVVAPAVGQELIHLLLKQVPFGLVLHGVAERLLIMAPCLIIWGALSFMIGKNRLVLLTPFSLGAFVLFLLARSAFENNQWIIPAYLAAGGILGIAIVGARRNWRPAFRAVSVPVWLLVVAGITFLWKTDPFPIRGVDQKAAQSVNSFDVPPFGFDFQAIMNSTSTVVTVAPQTPPAFPGTIDWEPISSVFAWRSGRKVAGGVAGIRRANLWTSEHDFSIMARSLGPETLFLENSGASIMAARINPRTDLGIFEIPPDLMTEPVQAGAKFRGRVFRWDKIGVLPLTANASVTDTTGRWTCLGIIFDTQRNSRAIALRRDQILLMTSRNWQLRQMPRDNYDKSGETDWALVLYDAKKGLAMLPDDYVGGKLGAMTACPAVGVNISLQDVKDTSNLQIVIFRRTYLGSVQNEWKSPEFVPSDFASPELVVDFQQNQRLSDEEFKRQLAALTAPPMSASRVEVGNYLYGVLRLVQRYPNYRALGDLATNRIAAFVPSHLPVFLDGLSVTAGASREFLFTALIHGMADSQKNNIFSALRRSPDLARVISARGWLDDARQPLYALLQSPRPLPFEAIQAIARFKDPNTYERLLAELEAEPGISIYDALSALPGIDAALDQSVERIWKSKFGLFDALDGVTVPELEIALQHGKPQALALLRRLILDVKTSPYEISSGAAWNLTETFKRHVQIPSPNDNIDVARVLQEHRPQDFHFDPAARRFVLAEKAHANERQ